MLDDAPQSPLDLLTALLGDSPDLRLLQDPVQGASIRESAGRHGVAPLVAWTARPHVGGSDREWCDRILMRSSVRYQRGLIELEQILGVLDKAGVECLTLKGPVLASRYYSPPFLRKPSLDIDLAVRREELRVAIHALEAEGYRGEFGLSEVLARSHHFGMIHGGGRPGVELHFRLSHGGYGIPVEEFFERAEVFQLASGREVRVLSPADELLHLVLHRAHGRFATLFHFYEIRKLWRGASAAVRAQAIQRAADHHFIGAFLLTDAGFRARWKEPLLPERTMAKTWLGGSIDQQLYAAFERLSEPGRELPLGVRLARRWLDLKLTDTPPDALRFLSRMLGVAWFQVWRAGWRTVRVNGPDRSREKPPAKQD